MIVVAPEHGSKELKPIIHSMGVPCEIDSNMKFSDAFFEGQGPHGIMGVGFERKRLHDMLNCILDNRYAGHQKVGMSIMCGRSYLIIEGIWKPRISDGILMEGHSEWDGYKEKVSWIPVKFRSVPVRYETLYRYLISVANSNVTVTFTRDIWGTCFDIVQHFQWYKKPWNKHNAMKQLQKHNLPALTGRPTLVRKWANDIDGIGVKFSEQAERIFETPIQLATSDEMDWLGIEGIGVPTAQSVIKQINGWE